MTHDNYTVLTQHTRFESAMLRVQLNGQKNIFPAEVPISPHIALPYVHFLTRINNINFSQTRKDCFTSDYFKGCVEVLQETDQLDVFKKYIIKLHGADPGI